MVCAQQIPAAGRNRPVPDNPLLTAFPIPHIRAHTCCDCESDSGGKATIWAVKILVLDHDPLEFQPRHFPIDLGRIAVLARVARHCA